MGSAQNKAITICRIEDRKSPICRNSVDSGALCNDLERAVYQSTGGTPFACTLAILFGFSTAIATKPCFSKKSIFELPRETFDNRIALRTCVFLYAEDKGVKSTVRPVAGRWIQSHYSSLDDRVVMFYVGCWPLATWSDLKRAGIYA